jgi:hypothetical protein
MQFHRGLHFFYLNLIGFGDLAYRNTLVSVIAVQVETDLTFKTSCGIQSTYR